MVLARPVILVVGLWSTPVSGGPASGNDLFAQGRALLEAGHPAEACAKFEASIETDPDAPGTMLNLGLCNRQLGRYATALAWFRKAQTHSSVGGQREHEDAAKGMTVELDALVPKVTIVLLGDERAAAAVTIDGANVAAVDFANLELDPGRHEIAVRAHTRTTSLAVVLAARQRETVTIDLGAGEQPRSRVPLIVTLAGGALGLAGIIWDVTVVGPAHDRVAAAVTQHAFETGAAEFESRRRVAIGLYAAAAVTVAAGITLGFTVYRHPGPPPIRIEASITADALGVRVGWSR